MMMKLDDPSNKTSRGFVRGSFFAISPSHHHHLFKALQVFRSQFLPLEQTYNNSKRENPNRAATMGPRPSMRRSESQIIPLQREDRTQADELAATSNHSQSSRYQKRTRRSLRGRPGPLLRSASLNESEHGRPGLADRRGSTSDRLAKQASGKLSLEECDCDCNCEASKRTRSRRVSIRNSYRSREHEVVDNNWAMLREALQSLA